MRWTTTTSFGAESLYFDEGEVGYKQQKILDYDPIEETTRCCEQRSIGVVCKVFRVLRRRTYPNVPQDRTIYTQPMGNNCDSPTCIVARQPGLDWMRDAKS